MRRFSGASSTTTMRRARAGGRASAAFPSPPPEPGVEGTISSAACSGVATSPAPLYLRAFVDTCGLGVRPPAAAAAGSPQGSITANSTPCVPSGRSRTVNVPPIRAVSRAQIGRPSPEPLTPPPPRIATVFAAAEKSSNSLATSTPCSPGPSSTTRRSTASPALPAPPPRAAAGTSVRLRSTF